MQGYLAIILHAHLPFVRDPNCEKCLEEHWLFEAITECYLPLVQVLRGWARDGLDARVTLSVSPTLGIMLRDSLLSARFERYLTGLIELAKSEICRTQLEPECRQLAWFYKNRLESLLGLYLEIGRDLIREFRRLRDQGVLEIITTAVTHAVLPLWVQHRGSLRAQVMGALDFYREWFGALPSGFWLPECAFAPEIEPILASANIKWTVVDTHGLLHARPRPPHGVFAPVSTPAGVAVFGRDSDSARQVWSRQCGYPGDPRYRDFYRDIGYDLDFEYVRPYLPAPTVRGYTGIKYYAVTGKVSPKRFYVPDAALQAVDEHVSDFLRARLQQLSAARHYMKCAPILVMPFDAELFGHWWFEGPIFLDHFVRKAMQYRDSLLISTPTAYLERTDVPCTMTLGLSSWGKGGYLETWLNERTSWIYPPLYAAARKMGRLAAAYKVTNELGARIITQAARELLIAQSSDWAFMISTDTNQAYAIRKIVGHLRNHSALCAQFESKSQDPALLEQLERESGIINPFNPQYFVN